MEVNDLWIGDLLQVIGSGEVGTFEGMQGDLVMVKIGEKIEYFDPSKLRPAPDPVGTDPKDEYSLITLDEEEKFEPTIDLHLDQLKGFEETRWPQPLDFQRQRCAAFIEKAIRIRSPRITIIHGIGEGVLKATVDDLLHGIPYVHHKHLASHGGATVVDLIYHESCQ